MFFVALMTIIAPSLARHQAFQAPLLVYPKLIEERSDGDTKVVSLHGALILNLRKSSVLAPTLLVRTFEEGLPVENYVDSSVLEKHLYEDSEQLAAVNFVQHGEGAVSLFQEGVIGPYHRIEPAEQSPRSNEGGIPHAIHLIRERKFRDKVHLRSQTREAANVEGRNAGTEGSSQLPEKVKVELFVVADRAHYTYFPTKQKFLAYLCTLLLSVNLRFSGMSDPKVTMILIGVELPKEEPYIVGAAGTMNDIRTLNEFREHARRHRMSYRHADAVFLLTGRDVHFEKGEDIDDAGAAFMAGLCTEDFVGLGEDIPGSYDGVFIVTHELGHILGAAHDGSDPQPEVIQGDPGAKKCPWKDGFLMSYEDGGPKHHLFSECSKEQIRHALRMRGPECWMVTSLRQYIPSPFYPGMKVKADLYCQIMHHKIKNIKAKQKDNELAKCKMRCCHVRGPRQICYVHDLLDYMSCGAQKICLRGVCKKDLAE